MPLGSKIWEGAKALGKVAVGGGAAGLTGGVGIGLGQGLLGSLSGAGQQSGGADLGAAGGAFMPQSGGGTNVAPGRTVVVSAPTPAPDPSLKVIAGLVAQALASLNKIDSNINAQRAEQVAAAATSAKQLREATLEGGGKAELAASPQMSGSSGGSGILGALGTAAASLIVYNSMKKDKSADQTAKDAALGSNGTPAPGPGDAVAPEGGWRDWVESGLNNLADMVTGEESGSSGGSRGGLSSPVKGGRLTSGTGGRVDPVYGGWQANHHGVDIGLPAGTPIYAAGDGKVIYAGWHGKTGYGWMVEIDHGGKPNVVTRYGHMLESPMVRVGQKVSKGKQIGKVGSTGKSTGNHLHLGVRVDGKWTEPSKYIGGLPSGSKKQASAEPRKDQQLAMADKPTGPFAQESSDSQAAPVAGPSTTNNQPRIMNASYAPSEQGSNAFDATDPSRYNNLGPGGLPDEQSTLKPEYTKIGASLGMAGVAGAPMVQNALYRSSASAPTPVPETVPAPKPIELKPPANDNVQSWLNYLKQEFKKAGSLKNGKFAKAVEEAAKKLAVKYPTLAKGLRSAIKNPKALAAIGAAIAVGVGIDWVTNYLREMFPEEVPLKPAKPAPVTPAPKPDTKPAPVTPAPAPVPVTPAPKPDTKPTPVPDTRTAPDAKPAPDARPEAAPSTGAGPTTPQDQPVPATRTPVVPVEPTPVEPDPGKPTPTFTPIPLTPVPKGFKKPKPVTPPGELIRTYGDRPGLTFKDREYDTERATGVSRGSKQLGLGRSEPQTGVIGEPLLLPPTPSFTPDRRANDIDSMSREREKSSRAPLNFDGGTADAYTPPAKAQAVRDQSTAANGGTGASPSSVPNPSAYDIVKEYQLYFLNPSAVSTMA